MVWIKNNIFLVSLFSAVLVGLIFISQRNQSVELNSSQRPPIQFTSSYDQNLGTPPTASSSSKENYEHKEILRPLFKTDIENITAIWDRPEEFAQWIKDIESRVHSEKGDLAGEAEAQWDLNQMPASQEEYEKFIAEAKHNALFKISEGIVKKDPSLIRKAFSGYRGVSILGSLQFHGYNKNQQIMLKLPDNFVAFNQKLLRKKRGQYKKRKVANDPTQEAIETAVESADAKDEEEKINLEALFEEKLKQTIYFSDLETSQNRMDEYWGGESHFFASITQAADYVITFLASNAFFSITPKQAQKKIEEVVGETLEYARANPQEFGLSSNAIPRDVADLDYEILAESLTRETAVQYALIGSGLSTVLGDVIINQLRSAQVYAAGILVAVGVETFFAALGSYWGTYLLVLLRRYQTYVRDAKEVITADGKEFLINQVPKFDPDLVFYSETTRIEMNKSWLWGFSFGVITHRFVSIKNWQRSGIWFVGRAAEMAASNNFILAKLGTGIFNLYEIVTEPIGSSIAKILKLPLSTGGIVSRILNYFKKAISITPARIATIIVDFGVTSVVIYTAIHTRLYASAQMLSRVYYAPEMAVHLSLNDKWHNFEPFLEASRKIFYPMCAYASKKDLNLQKMTPGEDEGRSASIRGIFDKRQGNCLRIIAAFEDISEARIESRLRSLATDGQLDPETVNYFYSNSDVSDEELVEVLAKAHTEYPEYYQVVWTTALKAIFAHGETPDEFYSIKNLVIAGKGARLYDNYNSYFEFSSFAGAKKINANRFEYILERLAYRARQIKIEKGRVEEGSALDLSEAFSVFWNFHRKNMRTYDKEILEHIRADEKGFWANLWDGIKSAKQNIGFLIDRWVSPLYQTTYRYEAENQIQEILETRR